MQGFWKFFLILIATGFWGVQVSAHPKPRFRMYKWGAPKVQKICLDQTRSVSTIPIYDVLNFHLDDGEKENLKARKEFKFFDRFRKNFSKLKQSSTDRELRYLALSSSQDDLHEQFDRFVARCGALAFLDHWNLGDSEVSEIMSNYWDKRVLRLSKKADLRRISRYPIKHLEWAGGGLDTSDFSVLSENKELRSLVVDDAVGSPWSSHQPAYDALLALVSHPESKLEVLSLDGTRLTPGQLVELLTRSEALKAICFNDASEAFNSEGLKPAIQETLQSHPTLRAYSAAPDGCVIWDSSTRRLGLLALSLYSGNPALCSLAMATSTPPCELERNTDFLVKDASSGKWEICASTRSP